MDADRGVRIDAVRDGAGLKAFIDIPWRVFAGDPAWVPPLKKERAEVLDRNKNPFFQHAEVELFTAWVDGRPCGRISAQIDRRVSARHGADLGHFGFLDAVDSGPVFDGLLNAAEAWLEARGVRRVLGPFSFSINDECGLLVDGFDTPPMVMMGHARPFYGPRIEAAGYTKAKDLHAFLRDDNSRPVSGAVQRLIDRARSDPRVTFRRLSWAQFDRDIQSILAIFNDAWADNWGFLPFEDAEIRHLAQQLKLLISEDYVAIADVDGEPAAFAMILPNLNEAIADLDGRLLPFGWARLLYRLKCHRIRGARMPLMGVRQRYHSSPLGAVLAYAVLDSLYHTQRAHGFDRYELSWILEDNQPVRSMIEAMGGRAYKTYRIYQKDLAG